MLSSFFLCGSFYKSESLWFCKFKCCLLFIYRARPEEFTRNWNRKDRFHRPHSGNSRDLALQRPHRLTEQVLLQAVPLRYVVHHLFAPRTSRRCNPQRLRARRLSLGKARRRSLLVLLPRRGKSPGHFLHPATLQSRLRKLLLSFVESSTHNARILRLRAHRFL